MWLLILLIIDILLVYSIMVTVNLIKLKNQNIVDRERFENTLNTLINLDPKIKKYMEVRNESKILKENAEHNDKVVDKVNWENMLLNKENQQLKKQVDEYKKLGFKYLQDKNNNLETQQKEFIEYLENESILHPQYGEYTYYGYRRKIIGEILSKYKEIIGVSNENNIK